MNGVEPIIDPSITRNIAVGLIAFFLLNGLRYTYRALLLRFVYNEPFSDPRLQQVSDSLPPDRSTTKAVAAYAVAILLAWICYAYIR